jgi:Ca2+-binding RTX toxin-like protein
MHGGNIVATITGTQQNDNLVGTQDNDTITGLAGHDISTGGDGGDRFVYQRLSDLSVWTGSVLPWHETITDFGNAGNVIGPDEDELLDFSALDNFLFIGDDDFSASGRSEYHFERFGAEGLLIQFDQNGDGTADRYMVLDQFRGTTSEDFLSPVESNLIQPSDLWAYHYVMGVEQDDTLVGSDNNDGTFGDRIYGFAGNDRIFGKDGSDELFGGAGNDRLDGGDGTDTYVGGPGNDVYIVDTTEHEDIIEEADGGIDLVITTHSSEINFNPLPANVENLTMTGTAYQAEGNNLSNIITANSANNRLGGGAGNDTISGGGGGDSIRAGTGHDWIRGGTGADYLLGESGADKFVYYTVEEAGFATDGTGDFIRDFEGINLGATERDRIDLHRIDADTTTAADDAFDFIGSGEFTGTAGELRDVSGTVQVVDPDPFFPDPSFQSAARLVEGDVDGDGAADFQLAVLQNGSTQLNSGDFYL